VFNIENKQYATDKVRQVLREKPYGWAANKNPKHGNACIFFCLTVKFANWNF